MSFYLFVLSVLFITALADLMVGVSNDAVNFLNSAIGAQVAKRRTIMIIASLGVLVGTTFSSGMMEVARKGIFNPEYYVMHDVMIIFLSVMLTDILLLDLYNTFALPTSTTVSIVFEILGGAVAIAFLKIRSSGLAASDIFAYINTKSVIIIVTGIGLSVVFAFIFGALIQFLTRVIFTFNYEKTFRRFGSLYCGVALTAISFFILVKGAKGSSLVTPEARHFIMSHVREFLVISFIAWTIFWQLIISFTKINVLKIIVLIGTFALALAFAANDLVNFIGAPLGALRTYQIGMGTGISPLEMTMEALKEPVHANTLILLFAGGVMVVTLWKSRKARSVTQTSVDLGRQAEGLERFESSPLARGIVRMGISIGEIMQKILPASVIDWISRRTDPEQYKLPPAKDGKIPAFDLLRAAVNLMVASALVSIGTSMKLPLSTTFVTFTVSMGTSFADKAWGRESAVYRVNGVITVIGGWFFTAFMAFSSCFLFSIFIYHVKLPAIILLLAFGLFFLYRSNKLHREREEKYERMEREYSFEGGSDSATRVMLRMGKLIEEISANIQICVEALNNSDRRKLKSCYREATIIAGESESIINDIFQFLRTTSDDSKGAAPRYAHTIGALQLLAATIQDFTRDCYKHIDNNHKAPDELQVTELTDVANRVTSLMQQTGTMLRQQIFDALAAEKNALKELQEIIYKYDKRQMKRIKSGKSKSRVSLLFVSMLSRMRRMAEQSIHLAELSGESVAEMPI